MKLNSLCWCNIIFYIIILSSYSFKQAVSSKLSDSTQASKTNLPSSLNINNRKIVVSLFNLLLRMHQINPPFQDIAEQTIRTKRQAGAGKFVDASKMGQTKIFRLYLQQFKNMWAPWYVGGAHPFHPEVPKAIVFSFKTKIIDYFFPPVGEPEKSNKR